MLTILSEFGCRQVPVPNNLPEVLVHIAFQSIPMLAIVDVNSGIPQVHRPFWASMTPACLYTLFQCMSVTPSKVLALLEEPFFINRAEAVVYGYLHRFIGNMSLEQVRVFLRFVSGSSVCTMEKLEVQFTGLSALARRPIAHTWLFLLS